MTRLLGSSVLAPRHDATSEHIRSGRKRGLLLARSTKSDARSVAYGGNDARAQACRDIQHPAVVYWLSDDLDSLLHKYPRGAWSVSAEPRRSCITPPSVQSAGPRTYPEIPGRCLRFDGALRVPWRLTSKYPQAHRSSWLVPSRRAESYRPSSCRI